MAECVLVQAKAVLMACAKLRAVGNQVCLQENSFFLKFSQLSARWQGKDAIKLFAHRLLALEDVELQISDVLIWGHVSLNDQTSAPI